ncbi:MAG TPA: hypothetical protein VL481_00165 [Verrucomicrobiae bacterium]|nr:hypothetical protein [Verrucomicrobiae bacterium]
MNNNKFSDDEAKPFHSHTFAEAANGSTFGATSAQSFGQRYQIDRNRKVVQRYSDSFVASSGHLREELKRRLESSDAQDDKHRSSQTTRQGFNAGEAASPPANIKPLSVPKRNFSEPPGRKYNPYS